MGINPLNLEDVRKAAAWRDSTFVDTRSTREKTLADFAALLTPQEPITPAGCERLGMVRVKSIPQLEWFVNEADTILADVSRQEINIDFDDDWRRYISNATLGQLAALVVAMSKGE